MKTTPNNIEKMRTEKMTRRLLVFLQNEANDMRY